MEKTRKSTWIDKAMALAVAGLLGSTLILVFLTTRGVTPAETTGSLSSATDPAGPSEYGSRLLSFVDGNDGSVLISDYQTSQQIRVLAAGSGSFIRGVLRTLTRERRMRGIGDEQPFELLQDAELGLVLNDPSTETKIVLQAFGHTNTEEFRRLLTETHKTNGFAKVATR